MYPMFSRGLTSKLPAKLKVEYIYTGALRCRIWDGLGRVKIKQLGIDNEGNKNLAKSAIPKPPQEIKTRRWNRIESSHCH